MPTPDKVFNNMYWRFLERICAQGVAFSVSLILARLLDPIAYGTVALTTVFISIMQVFVNCGFGNALIQKQDADDLDFSSVFYFNIIFCILIFAVMYCFAPFIASFYNRVELVKIIRVQSLIIILSGPKNIQQAYVSRFLIFKKFFFSTLSGTLGAAFIGIILAWKGYGVWALVIQELSNSAIDTTVLFLTVKWRPKLMFSAKRLASLFSFGWKLLLSSLLDVFYQSAQSLIIGKFYSSSDLAFYNRGHQLPQLIITNLNASIDSVLFPTMSMEQNNRGRVLAITRRAIKTSSYIVMPLMMALGICAEPLVKIVLTVKWLPCVFYIRAFCIAYAFWPVHTANLNAIKALGRSDIFLKLEIIKKFVGLICLAGTVFISVKAITYGIILASVISIIINSRPTKILLGYTLHDQLLDMMPQIILSSIMGIVMYCICFFNLSDICILLIQLFTGVGFYIAASELIRIDSYTYLKSILKNKLNKINR